MRSSKPECYPVKGKTYTLFGGSDSTAGYYTTIRNLAEKALLLNPDVQYLVESIGKFSLKKRQLKKSLNAKKASNLMEDILRLIDPSLKQYTTAADEHLRTLPISKYWDRRLATSREQYHLYMLEIELTNRLFMSEFMKADKKIALMPYCLQDFSVSCKSEKTGFDYQCRHCSPGCFQNSASNILKSNHIEPYIWMDGNMKQLARYTLQNLQTFGVLGIACIPELTYGMRNCRINNIPVVGIPLNANRCIRWMGNFMPNSIDLIELEKLLAGGNKG
jgi:hypothetical protein